MYENDNNNFYPHSDYNEYQANRTSGSAGNDTEQTAQDQTSRISQPLTGNQSWSEQSTNTVADNWSAQRTNMATDNWSAQSTNTGADSWSARSTNASADSWSARSTNGATDTWSAQSANAAQGRMENGPQQTWMDKAPTKKEKSGEPGKVGGFFRKAILSVSLGLVFGLFAGLGFYAVQKGAGLFVENNTPIIESEAEAQQQLPFNSMVYNSDDSTQAVATNITMVESDVSQMVEDVMPAMVSIVNTATEEVHFWGQTFTQDTPYSGSGIIVGETDNELLIVTNYHVVENANKLEVTFIDESMAEAQIKGTDEDMDLAVIAVSLKDLDESTMDAVTVATLGNSDTLKLGERVVAIGNALGYGQSVTGGYISALNREVEIEEGQTATYIQTDAAINGGNSGGALLNMKGEVIGINSAKLGGSYIEGMGYAIPISSASPIIADLMERQTRNKVDESDVGYMGISLQAVTSEIAGAYNMPVGIYVVSTEEGSAAQKAGIVSGDIITKIDGQKVSTYEGLQKQLQYYAAGDDADVTIMRPENGEYVEHTLQITFGRRPNNAR